MTPPLPKRLHFAGLLLLSLLFLLSAALPVSAQGIIIDPPPVPPLPRPIVTPIPPPVQVSVESQRVDATVSGQVATVQISQLFRNVSTQAQEGTFLFPLPRGAAIGDLQLTVDDQVLEGKLLKKEEARRIYEEIVRQQRDPALLEYMGQDLYRTSVFPIPAESSRTVKLTYREIIRQENGLLRFTIPLDSRQTPTRLAVNVELTEQPGLRTLYSPSHAVAIERRGDNSAVVGFESSDPTQQRDFTLYWGNDDSAIGVNLLSYKPTGEEGFFLLLAAPGLDVAPNAVVERDIVLVLDVSGSMEGEKLAQAQDAARFVVSHLNDGDRFNLISFSTGVDRWQAGLQATSDDSRNGANQWIDRLRATGSTDINRALLEALALLDDPQTPSRPAYVLFLTDGLPTQGVEAPDVIIANAQSAAPEGRKLRLFTFGVGYDVNTDLLDEVSANLGGRSSYVQPDEEIDEAVSSFYAGVSTPVLSALSVTLTGADGAPVAVNDSYPFPLPDLFAGGQLVWAGRYTAGGPVAVELAGDVNGVAQRFRYDDLALAESGGESAVARLWATRKIGALLTAVRRYGANPETVEAIIELSLAYGIVTPYTSYLVEEPESTAARTPVQWDASVADVGVAPRAQAYAAAPAALEQSASADAFGETAVKASQARSQLSEAQAPPQDERVRYLAGKSFVQKGNAQAPDGALYPLWIDTALAEGMPSRRVVFGSADYFALAQDERAAQWLSLSPALVVVIDGEAVQVVLEGSEQPAPAEEPSPVDSPTVPSFWQRLLDLLLGR